MTVIDERRTSSDPDPDDGGRLEPGTKIEVRSTLERRWGRGFEVIEATDRGYRVRRLTDNAELPGEIAARDVRKERKRGTWWY
ncbi:MAG: hypothetical protein R2726_07230 [Acidimicrobiales bacterium]